MSQRGPRGQIQPAIHFSHKFCWQTALCTHICVAGSCFHTATVGLFSHCNGGAALLQQAPRLFTLWPVTGTACPALRSLQTNHCPVAKTSCPVSQHRTGAALEATDVDKSNTASVKKQAPFHGRNSTKVRRQMTKRGGKCISYPVGLASLAVGAPENPFRDCQSYGETGRRHKQAVHRKGSGKRLLHI